MKLIKINQDHYVVVTDEPIEEGNYYLDGGIIKHYDNMRLFTQLPIGSKKVLKTTNGYYLGKIEPLDLSYIKSLVGEVDVTEKANIQFDKDTEMIPYPSPFWFESQDAQFHSYIKGYNQCLEEYTKSIHEILDHLIDKMDSISQEMIDKDPLQLGRYRTFKYVFDYIKSLTQPKDTWEVEFDENNNLKLK